MKQFDGQLFRGRLFAGRLFQGLTQETPPTPVNGPSGGTRWNNAPRLPRKRPRAVREEEDLLVLA